MHARFSLLLRYCAVVVLGVLDRHQRLRVVAQVALIGLYVDSEKLSGVQVPLAVVGSAILENPGILGINSNASLSFNPVVGSEFWVSINPKEFFVKMFPHVRKFNSYEA